MLFDWGLWAPRAASSVPSQRAPAATELKTSPAPLQDISNTQELGNASESSATLLVFQVSESEELPPMLFYAGNAHKDVGVGHAETCLSK